MFNVEKYIGYIIDSNHNHGTFFVIGKNKAVTANHVYNKMTKPLHFFLNDREIAITEYKSETKKELTVITTASDVFDSFCYDELQINISLSFENGADTPWEFYGYLPCNGNSEFRKYSGRTFSEIYGRFPIVLTDCRVKSPSIVGMSGSPVFVNDLLVGVLQAEDLNNNGLVENLYMSPISDIVDDLCKECIPANIHLNAMVDKHNYSDDYQFDDYIFRSVQVIDDSDPDTTISEAYEQSHTLKDIVTRNKTDHLFVLLGEAGIGKSIELQRLAVDLYQSDYYPIVFSLKNYNSNEKPEEQIVGLKEYIQHEVPFCLILDGFDEIKDTQFRDIGFPDDLLSFTNRVNEKYKKNKTKFSIVLSSRRNYYYEGKITRAVSVELSDLALDDVYAMLDKYLVDQADFMEEVHNKHLNTFILNPFYLIYIIKLYLAENGTLPDRKNLMDEIIDHLFRDKNFEKFRGRSIRYTKENTKGKMILSKISACYIIQGRTKLTQDEIILLTDGYLDDTDFELVQSTSIIDKDDEDNWVFKHQNFCEYLSAVFFKDFDLEHLLELIAYEDHSGIYNHYLNMVAYLLQIRENSDLSDWIINNCPDIYPNFEYHHLTPDLSLSILQSINRTANEKAYYLLTDCNLPIRAIINNEMCIAYLLGRIKETKNDRELLSVLRLIDSLKDSCSLDNQIRETLLSLLDSDKCNQHHIRDTIYILADHGLGNGDVTAHLFEKYKDTQDKEIILAINYYVYIYNVADLFIDVLIFQLENVDYSHFLGSYFHESLRLIEAESSFIKLFKAMMKIGHTNHSFYRCSETESTLFSYNAKLVTCWQKKRSKKILFTVLTFSSFLINEYIVKKNPFAAFLNATGTDNLAIEYYYEKCKNDPIAFQLAAGDLECYEGFLLDGYASGRFKRNTSFLFDYCLKCLHTTSRTREKGIELIRLSGSDNADNTIRFITENDNYEEKKAAKRKRLKEYVFDLNKLKEDLSVIIHESGIDNPRYQDLFDFVYGRYEYTSCYSIAFNCARSVFFSDHTIRYNLNYYHDHPDEWEIISFKYFIFECNDFADYITREECDRVLKKAKSFISEVNFHDCNIMLVQDAVLVLQQFDYDLSEELFIKLLQLPEYYFKKYSSKGFPDYLINHLSSEIIIDQIESFIQSGELNRYLCDSCISYCDSLHYVSDNIVQLAKRVLCNEFSTDNHYTAWNYLLHNKKANILIDLINKGLINRGFVIYQLPTLSKSFDEELADRVLSLFEELNDVYLNGITAKNADSMLEKYKYLIRYDNAADAESKLKSNLLDAIRCLFEYLFVHDRNGCVDLYLDFMIEQKTNSYLESRDFGTLAAQIDSIKHLKKLIQLLKMQCDGSFVSKRNMHNLFGDIKTAILNIGHKYPVETIDCLSHYLKHSNRDFKRVVSLLTDNLIKEKNEKQNNKYSIADIRQIVFCDKP